MRCMNTPEQPAREKTPQGSREIFDGALKSLDRELVERYKHVAFMAKVSDPPRSKLRGIKEALTDLCVRRYNFCFYPGCGRNW